MTFLEEKKRSELAAEMDRLYPVALADEMSRRRSLGGPNASVREWSLEELVEIRARAWEVAIVLAGGCDG